MNENSVNIARAEKKEAATIANILYQSFIEFKHLYTDKAFAATAITSDQVIKRMEEGDIWIAVMDKNIIGTSATVVKPDGLYIRGMAVLPQARGHKTGHRLLAHIEQNARQNGHRRLFLSTTPFLHSAIRLYEQFGFKRTNERLYDFYGTELFNMEKCFV
jgi:N-acetylglutamate synthase-like GNAT family acetyltransferase